MQTFKHTDVTERIIGAFYKVYNTLGWGFLENVYQNAMEIELEKHGLNAFRNAPIDVYYDEILIGKYFADFLVNGCVIVELKAVEHLVEAHHAQVLNYLRATDIEIGLLMNFGPRPEIKGKILETARKGREIQHSSAEHADQSQMKTGSESQDGFF